MIPIRAASLCLPAFVAGILGCAVSLVAADALDGSIIRSDLSPAERKRVAEVTKPAADFSKAEPYEAMESGATTSIAPSLQMLSQPSANLDKDKGLDFHRQRLSASRSPHLLDGDRRPRPAFNARSCQTCHIKDGRGHPLEADGNASSMLWEIGPAGKTPEEQKAIRASRDQLPDPTYGTQLRPRSAGSFRRRQGRGHLQRAKCHCRRRDRLVTQAQPFGCRPCLRPADPETTLSARCASDAGSGLIGSHRGR